MSCRSERIVWGLHHVDKKLIPDPHALEDVILQDFIASLQHSNWRCSPWNRQERPYTRWSLEKKHGWENWNRRTDDLTTHGDTRSTSVSGVQRHVILSLQSIAKMIATYCDYCASLRDLKEHLPRNSSDVLIVMVHQVEVWHHKGHLGAQHAQCHERQSFAAKELG